MKTNLHCSGRRRKIGSCFPKFTVALLLFIGICQTSAYAQAQQRINLRMERVTAEQLVNHIRETTRYRISFLSEDLRQVPTRDYSFNEATITQVMDNLVSGTNLEWSDQNGTIVITRRNPVNGLQAIEIRGNIKGEDGNPLIKASVSVKGESKAVVTDANGMYAISVERGKTLVFSYMGYIPQEIVAGTQTTLNVVLQVKQFLIDEIVVNTGYQKISMEKMTGSSTTVTADELATRYTPNIMDNLEGRVAGLMRYGDKTTIRGISSIHANTTPLAVVDGLPYEGSLEDINPYDVESITVLKDAAATAIYGARASNGIIVITTKQAKEKGKTIVDVSANFSIYRKPDYSKYNYMTAAEQVDFENDYYDWYFNGGTISNPAQEVANLIEKGSAVSPIQYAYYQLAQGDISQTELNSLLDGYRQNNFAEQFRKHALRNRFLQQYNVAVRSRGEKFQSNLVFNFKRDNMGIIKASENQINVQYKGSYDVADWFSVNFGINTIFDENNESNSTFADSPFNVSPYMRLMDGNGERVYYATSNYNAYNPLTVDNPDMESMLFNHLDELGRDRQKTSRQKTRYFANMNFRILHGLTFTPQFQYESDRSNITAYSEEESYIMRYLNNIYTSRTGTEGNYTYSYLLPTNGGKLAATNVKGDSWTARGQINYSASFGKHYIEVIGGTEFRQTRSKGTRGLLLGYDDQLQSHSTASVNFAALGAVTSTGLFKPGLNPGGTYSTYISGAMGPVTETTHRFNSIYANATYTYDRKYNAFASFRKDYADVFGLDKKYRGKPLWSAGFGWNVHNEEFIREAEWVGFLKVRASYGVTGNIYLGATSYLTANSSLINNATKLPVSVVEAPDNAQLRWEKNATLNVGIDFSFFSNRFTGALDVYGKKGSDIFATTRMDPTEGFTEMIINNGDLLNKGVEVTLNYTWFAPKQRDGFRWSSSLVVGYNKNEITYVDEVSATPLALVQGGFLVGRPVNSLFSFQYKGINENGFAQWQKADGTLTTTAMDANDMDAVVFSGGADPKVNIGFSNEFHYKGLSLNVIMVYYGGHYLRALQPSAYNSPGYGPLPSYLLDSWTPDNTDTLIPGFGRYATTSPSSYLTYSDAFVRPGAFLKIRNIVLGYELPENLTRRIGMKRANVSFQVNNPGILWKKTGVNIDPETGGVPQRTYYVLGINLNF